MSFSQGSVILQQKRSAGGPVTAGARNGTSIVSGYVELGGALIQNTAVDLAGAFTFEFDINGANRGFFINPLTNLFQLGDIDAVGNGLKLTIADGSDIITFSDAAGDLFFVIDRGTFTYQFGDISGLQNRSNIEIDDTNQRLRYLSGAGGFPYFDLNVGSGQYNYGDLGASGNQSNVTLSDTTQQFGFATGGVYYFFLDVGAGNYSIGDITFAANGTYFFIDDTNQVIQTFNQGAANGMYLNFVSGNFSFGDINDLNNGTKIIIDDSLPRISMGDVSGIINNTTLIIDDGAQQVVARGNNGFYVQASGQLIGSFTTLTNNAGVAAGTLLNAPAAGNPTKWIPIDDNGTIRNIPAW